MRIRGWPAFVTVAAICLSAGVTSATAALHCGDTVIGDTTLKKDLTCSGTDGVVIGGAGIKLDLNGHTITGDTAGTGIRNSTGFAGVKIIDGRIRGFGTSLHLIGATDNVVRKVDMRGAAASGARIDGGSQNEVDQSVIRNDVGNVVELTGGTGNTISDSQIRGDVRGVRMGGGTGSTLSGNTIRDAGNGVTMLSSVASPVIAHNDFVDDDRAVEALSATDITAKGNHISRLVTEGILIQSGSGHLVKGNTVEGGTWAIRLFNVVNDTVIDHNHTTGATTGVRVEGGSPGPDGIEVTDNEVLNSTGFGIRMEASMTGSELIGNYVKGSAESGIWNQDDDVLVESNTVVRNTKFGITSASANGSGNVALNNGFTPQCVPTLLCD
jgi:parallel beta-helix repeat protein